MRKRSRFSSGHFAVRRKQKASDLLVWRPLPQRSRAATAALNRRLRRLVPLRAATPTTLRDSAPATAALNRRLRRLVPAEGSGTHNARGSRARDSGAQSSASPTGAAEGSGTHNARDLNCELRTCTLRNYSATTAVSLCESRCLRPRDGSPISNTRKEIHRETDWYRQVVQRREGLRLHHL